MSTFITPIGDDARTLRRGLNVLPTIVLLPALYEAPGSSAMRSSIPCARRPDHVAGLHAKQPWSPSTPRRRLPMSAGHTVPGAA